MELFGCFIAKSVCQTMVIGNYWLWHIEKLLEKKKVDISVIRE